MSIFPQDEFFLNLITQLTNYFSFFYLTVMFNENNEAIHKILIYRFNPITKYKVIEKNHVVIKFNLIYIFILRSNFFISRIKICRLSQSVFQELVILFYSIKYRYIQN